MINRIYRGTIKLKGKEEALLLSLNTDYIISVIYVMLTARNKEAFYREIYNVDGSINEEVFELLLEFVQVKKDLFSRFKGKDYLSDSVYQIDEYSVLEKTVSIEVNICLVNS